MAPSGAVGTERSEARPLNLLSSSTRCSRNLAAFLIQYKPKSVDFDLRVEEIDPTSGAASSSDPPPPSSKVSQSAQEEWPDESFWDDISGVRLDPKRVQAARKEEMGQIYKPPFSYDPAIDKHVCTHCAKNENEECWLNRCA